MESETSVLKVEKLSLFTTGGALVMRKGRKGFPGEINLREEGGTWFPERVCGVNFVFFIACDS